MAGHSHWAGIKIRKAAQDKKRGKIFSKISKSIISAVRQGGSNPESNLKLKYAIDRAREANMPKDNVDRAIKRGTGELPGVELEELRYEGFGPAGTAFMVEAVTDNRQRTDADIRPFCVMVGGGWHPREPFRGCSNKRGFSSWNVSPWARTSCWR